MKQTTHQTLFSLLAATLLISSVQANENKSLDPVNVTASAIVERDDIKLDSVTNLYRVEKTAEAGTQVLTKEDIEAYAPKDFFDLMDKAIGVDLTYQGRRNPFQLNVRGGGNMTYIIDGAILPSTTARILQKIPMSAIEEIQIIRGSTALYLGPSIGIGASSSSSSTSSTSGSGVNTGFIVIRTRQPKTTEGLISTYIEKSESFPTANGQSLFLGTRLGSSASGLSGYVGGLISRFDRPSNDTWYDASEAESGMITGGLTYGRFSINIMGYKDDGRFELQRGVKPNGSLDASKWSYDPYKTDVLSADMNMQWNENQNTLFSLFSTKYQNVEIVESFANTSHSERNYEENSRGYSLRHNARFGDTLIQLGGQILHSDGFGPNLFNSYNNFETSIMGLSASVEQTLFNGTLILDAGYRQDQKHIDHSAATSSTNITLINNLNNTNNDVDMAPARVYALGALWKINPTFALSGRYFQGDEGSNGDFNLITYGSTALHAEKQKRIEITLDSKISSYFNPTLTWFNVDIENQKVQDTAHTPYTGSDGELYYYYTETDTLRRGIELSVKGKSVGFDYLLAWTRMNENSSTTATGITTDIVGVQTPEDSITAKVGYQRDNYRANISAKKVTGWNSSTNASGTSVNGNVGDYIRVDANVAGDFKYYGNTYTAKLYGRNLGDDQYATVYSAGTGYYYDRGRVIGVELSMAF